MQKMTKGTTEAVAEWATPLFRQSEYYDKRAVRGTPRIFTLPTTSIETDDKGQVTGTKNIHIPRGFQVVPVSTSGRIMATTETHGISALERQYFIEGLEKILNLSPEERSKYFTQIGDAERLLPEFAKALAEAKLDQAGSGSIESCGGCNLSFYTEQKMSKEAPKVEKTEGGEANDVEPKPEPYCCTGCKKAGGNGKK
jgi:hypothetical protein